MNIRIVLHAITIFALTLAGVSRAADSPGQVVHLSGTMSAQKADGGVRILSRGSEIHVGDTLTTQADSYGQLTFSDGSTMTMRPNTTMKVDAYKFDMERAKAADDLVIARDGAVVVIDPVSVDYMAGSEIDFVEDVKKAELDVLPKL